MTPPLGDVIVDTGAVESVDGPEATRPACNDPAFTFMSAKRFTVACCSLTSMLTGSTVPLQVKTGFGDVSELNEPPPGALTVQRKETGGLGFAGSVVAES